MSDLNEKIQELLTMTREAALYAGSVASKGIDIAANKTNEFIEATRLNKKLYEEATTVNALLMDVGDIVYRTHCGEETDADELQSLLEQIDGIKAELQAARERLDELRNDSECPECGDKTDKADKFCKHCGKEL